MDYVNQQAQPSGIPQILQQLNLAPTQTSSPQSTLQSNFNYLSKIIETAQAAQNPIAYLQSKARELPIVQQALSLGEKYNGDYDAATRDILKENQIDENEFRKRLNQLGIK